MAEVALLTISLERLILCKYKKVSFMEKFGRLFYGTEIEKYLPAKQEQNLGAIDFLQYVKRKKEENCCYYWVIIHGKSKEVIGFIYTNYDTETDCIHLQLAIREQWCKKKYIKEAIVYLKEYYMENIKVNRMDIFCAQSENEVEMAIVESGFLLEGTLREAVFYGKEKEDLKIYGILQRQYQDSRS